jgi:MoaA/NifB/PqqE/SkfB family radical SAM enzyme
MHPDILDVLAAHPDCYFQIFTNGQLITPKIAKELRRLGNATPLISIEGTEIVSDDRRGSRDVLNKTMEGLKNALAERLIVGVATSVCQTNFDLVNRAWLEKLIDMGVMYAWFHTYRVVGPVPEPQLALTPEQVLHIRRFVVTMRKTLPIGLVDAYWDDKGQALCPMATGVSHHIGPSGAIEPCPIIQFAKESIHDSPSLYQIMTKSEFLSDFRREAAKATRGCIVLERPDLVRSLVDRHAARDTTQRLTATAELENLLPRTSQHLPGQEIPEEHWLYRFAKKHYFFGFGAYT